MSETRGIPADERNTGAAPVRGSSGAGKRVGIYLAIALVIFLAGFVPMWLKARAAGTERAAVERELRLSRMQSALSTAAVDARRGDYEAARRSASDFFTALSAQVEETGASASDAPQQQREAVRPLLAQRDDVITRLARSDPSSADLLSDMSVAYRKATNSAQTQNATN